MKSKINIMKTRPQVTQEEINRFMDFEMLLKKKVEMVSRQRRSNQWRVLSIGTISLLLVALFAVIISQRQGTDPKIQRNEREDSPTAVTPAADSSQPELTHPEQIAETPARPSAESPSHADDQDASPSSLNESKRGKESVPKPSGYVQPEPVDGYPALYAYFDKALRYPAVAVKDSIEGVVTVEFVIDLHGKATDVVVENSLGEAFDAEVRRLLLNMPEWRPATYDGNPVRSKVSIPITFSLSRNTNP